MVTYVDTSALLAWLLVDDHVPEQSFWAEALVSSRLAEYEVHCRLSALAPADDTLRQEAVELLRRLRFVELSPVALRRVLLPFPRPVRTLDAIHLASALLLWKSEPEFRLATYDRRLSEVSVELGMDLHPTVRPAET